MSPLSIALSVLLAALAWRYARTWPRHWPFATLVLAGQLAEGGERALKRLVIEPARAAGGGAPLLGSARVAFHLDEALRLAWPAGLAAVAALVFLHGPAGRRAAKAIGVVWMLALAALAVFYPAVRGAVLGRAYLAAELAALAGVIAAGWAWWGRREMPSLVEGSVMVLAAVELAAVIGWAPFARGWDWQWTAYLTGYGVLVFLHVGEAWSLKSSPKSSRSS